jgi:hypothetical protein
LLESLLEHALAPVGREHLVVECQPVEGGEAALADALAGGFLLEFSQEAVEAAFVIALRGQRRRADMSTALARMAATAALIFNIDRPH